MRALLMLHSTHRCLSLQVTCQECCLLRRTSWWLAGRRCAPGQLLLPVMCSTRTATCFRYRVDMQQQLSGVQVCSASQLIISYNVMQTQDGQEKTRSAKAAHRLHMVRRAERNLMSYERTGGCLRAAPQSC
jgi:ethanolamine ammonia-lyase large subunit